MFVSTLKFFAALAIVIGILYAAGAVLTYRPEFTHEEVAKREAAQAEIDKRRAEEDAQTIERAEQDKEDKRAEWKRDHPVPKPAKLHFVSDQPKVDSPMESLRVEHVCCPNGKEVGELEVLNYSGQIEFDAVNNDRVILSVKYDTYDHA